MSKPADVNVLVYASVHGIAQTMRMALRGIGVRTVHLAVNMNQMLEGFSVADPHVAVIYVDGSDETDPGLQMLAFIRRHAESPRRDIPVVVVSQRRDMSTIQAASNAGAHEYVLFPVSGDVLLKKVHAARTSNRGFIDTPDYVGPDRKPVARGA
jgi:DNA-binding NarL/FixJ family response regulator